MADEIKQTLGFDASQALDALRQLDSLFGNFDQRLRNISGTFTTFNQSAGKTVSALVQITENANKAADAINRLNRIKPPPSVAGGGLPTGGGAGAAASPSQPLLTGNAAAAALNQLLGQTAEKAKTASGALTRLGEVGSDALDKGRRSGNGFAVSLETITRVITTQVIVRALSAIREAVRESFTDFISFNRALAEIQTIAPENEQSLKVLGDSVRKLSDDFNAPILDVAKAKYEILSNGFVTTAESTSVLTAALKFAKVGISDVSQAADLISTSLNAYGKSADEAETISAKLFKTIELGRVIGSELATSFGRVAPVGKEVGATEDELLAAFSSITIGGVKAAEAATQIRASLTALLKPSEAAKDALHELGFETGEQLIQARGYQGALQALISTTDGSATAIAALFPNVRALNGVLRETGTGVDIFQEHLKAIQESSRELLNQKFEIRVESNAEQVDANLNKIRNFFTVELGSQLVKGVNAAFSAVPGGIETVLTAFRSLTPVIEATAAALAAYAVQQGIASIASRTLSADLQLSEKAAARVQGALNGFAGGIALGIAAQSLGRFIGESITRFIEEARKQAANEANQLIEFNRGQAEARTNLAKVESDAKFRALQDFIGKARKLYFEETDAAIEANKQILEDDRTTLDKLISARQGFVNDLRNAAEQADSDIVASHKRANDIQGQLDDQRFSFQTKRLGDLSKFFADRDRSQQLASQAAAALAKAHTPDEKAAADAAFQRADAFAKQAAQSAQTAGNLTAQFQAEENLESILQKRLDAEKQFQKTRAQDADQAREAAAAEQERVDKLKELTKIFLENSSLVGKNGKQVPVEELPGRQKAAEDALAQIKQLAFSSAAKFDIGNLFDFDRLQQRFQQSFSKGEIDNLFASEDALKRLVNQVQGAFDKTEVILSFAIDPTKLVGKNRLEQLDEVSKQLNAQKDQLDELAQADVKRGVAQDTIAQSLKQQLGILNEQKGVIENLVQGPQTLFKVITGSAGDVQKAFDQLHSFQDEIQKLSENPSVTTATVQDLSNRLDAFAGSAPTLLNADIARLRDQYNLLVLILQKRLEIRQQDKLGNTTQATQQQFQILDQNTARKADAEAAANAARTTEEAERAAAAASQNFQTSAARTASASAQIASNAEKTAQAYRQAATAAAQAAAAGGGGGTVAAATGGLIRGFAVGGLVKGMRYFDQGGFAPRGTDTVPAMLTPGEFVVNAAATRKFYSQLVAINSGRFPIHRAEGGPVTNINVGDIVVQGSNSPQSTARAVMDQIRREQRRGTAVL